MPNSERIIMTLLDLSIPVLGFLYMKTVDRGVKKILVTKVIDKGYYKSRPVSGDAVIPIAKSFKRIGIIIFIFSLVFSIMGAALLIKYW